MLGPPKLPCLDRPVAVSLEALVPPDNFYRHLDAKLDLGFVRELVRERYAEDGRPSIDPVVFFKLQLVMFFEGVRSERKLVEAASLNLAHRWYLGYHLDEPLPDHSSPTRIRDRYGLAVFRRFFERVVELCQEAGLVWGKELLFDATKVPANAAVDSLVPRLREVAQAHVEELFAGDDADRGAPEPPPAPWDVLEECRLDPARPPVNGYQRKGDLRVSTTDPDAAPMSSDGGLALGYHDHYVVEGGRARIILFALVTPADVMENQPMLDLLWRVRFR